MWTVSKDFTFSASHRLEGLEPGHKCGRLHGHGYRVRVELSSAHLDRHGFVLDYGELSPFAAYLQGQLDHRHLNDVIDFQPSAENLAALLHGVVLDVVPVPASVTVAVGVSETEKTWAWWRP